MPLFFSLLPIYILGNIHCLGMCGPLVMMIGRHQYRYFYFLGRILSYAIAGWIAGGMGTVLTVLLGNWYLPALISLAFGALIATIALYSLTGVPYPGYRWFGRKLGTLSKSLSLLLLKDEPYPAFLFGLGTILLPCGQTVVVFSACAIYGDPFVGLANGTAFALLTSPSLWMGMHAQQWFFKLKDYNHLFGWAALLTGFLAICRGLADLSIIPHLVLSSRWHIVIF